MLPTQYMYGTLGQKFIIIDDTPAITLTLGGDYTIWYSFIPGIYENDQLQFKRYGH